MIERIKRMFCKHSYELVNTIDTEAYVIFGKIKTKTNLYECKKCGKRIVSGYYSDSVELQLWLRHELDKKENVRENLEKIYRNS